VASQPLGGQQLGSHLLSATRLKASPEWLALQPGVIFRELVSNKTSQSSEPARADLTRLPPTKGATDPRRISDSR
jgi:hypothetical protein